MPYSKCTIKLATGRHRIEMTAHRNWWNRAVCAVDFGKLSTGCIDLVAISWTSPSAVSLQLVIPYTLHLEQALGPETSREPSCRSHRRIDVLHHQAKVRSILLCDGYHPWETGVSQRLNMWPRLGYDTHHKRSPLTVKVVACEA